ncbi:MAG: pseudouridine synthase [Candidatus Hepatoplasma vulgare]|nr:MAG: pseudouridine synthase [Candidatus Hepatoplasma sp.]
MKININYDFGIEKRIDQYLVDYFFNNETIKFSRSQIKHLINNGRIKDGDLLIKKSGYLLKGKGIITIDIPDNNNNEKLMKWDRWDLINIVYENSDYLVINKPANLPVHPGNGNYDKTLVNILVSRYDKLANSNTIRPGIVHRIDKHTTGVLVIAKTDEAFFHIQNQFINREVNKIYFGLTKGNFKEKKGKVFLPLIRSRVDPRMITVAKNGREATTLYQVIERFDGFDFVEFKILTGRTHQIRVHCKYLNAPIYNDYLYGKKEISNPNIGHFLHARSIEFKDLNNKWVKYEAELPYYFKDKLEELRKEEN